MTKTTAIVPGNILEKSPIERTASDAIMRLRCRVRPKLQYFVDSHVDLTDDGLYGFWEIAVDVMGEVIDKINTIIVDLCKATGEDIEIDEGGASEAAQEDISA